MEPKKKVQILAEYEYEAQEIAPPNFFPWFKCQENWNFCSDSAHSDIDPSPFHRNPEKGFLL